MDKPNNAPQPKARAKDRPDSRTAILAAAREEFLERGYDGARMEHIARRSGFNKALVYKHFTDRDQLFRAVLESAFAGRKAVLQQQPYGLGATLAAWSAAAFTEPAYGRLLMREELDHKGGAPVLADERRRYYAAQIAGVRRAQSRGRLPEELPAEYLFLALLSVVSLPAFLPHVTVLVSGLHPDDDAFQNGWSDFLRAFGDTLSGAAGSGTTDDAQSDRDADAG